MKTNILQPYRALVFDFDLTIADASAWIVQSFQTVLRANGYGDVDDEACRRTIGMTLENAFVTLTGRSFVDEDVWRMKQEYIAVCRPKIAEHTTFYPEALTFLHRMREEGKRLAIVSTKMASVIRQTLERYDMTSWFEVIVGGEDVTQHKPDPTGLLCAMERLGVSKEETLYFGDNIIDAQTAVNAGVDYVGTLTGVHTRAELEAYPHVAVVQHLEHLL